MAQLRGYIDEAQTTIPVDDTTNFPVDGGVVTIEGESVRYSRATDKALLGCERGYNSTSADEHADHTPVDVQDTSAPLYSLQEYQGHGAPDDHFTGVGFALKGSRYTDLDTAIMYINLASETDPHWVPFAEGDASGASGADGAIQTSNGAGGFTNLSGHLDFSSATLTVNALSEFVELPALVFKEDDEITAELHKNPASGSVELINQDGAVFIESNEGPISLQADGYITLENGDGGIIKFENNDLFTDGQPLNLKALSESATVSARDIALVTDEGISNKTWTFDDAGVLTEPSGLVIQGPHVTQTTSTSATTVASTSYTAVGPSQSFAVSKASHKVKVTIQAGCQVSDTNSQFAYVSIAMDTVVCESGAALAKIADAGSGTRVPTVPCQVSYIFTPGDTSAHTYQGYVKGVSADNIVWNPSFNGAGTALIICEEIAA